MKDMNMRTEKNIGEHIKMRPKSIWKAEEDSNTKYSITSEYLE